MTFTLGKHVRAFDFPRKTYINDIYTHTHTENHNAIPPKVVGFGVLYHVFLNLFQKSGSFKSNLQVPLPALYGRNPGMRDFSPTSMRHPAFEDQAHGTHHEKGSTNQYGLSFRFQVGKEISMGKDPLADVYWVFPQNRGKTQNGWL